MRRPTAPSAQDCVEIQNLYAYYNLTSDSGDAEAYADCWTDARELSIKAIEFSVKGRDNFTAVKKKDKEGRAGKYRRHWNGSIFLEKVDDNTLRGRCYLDGYNGSPGSLPAFADAGVYDDLIIRVDGQWRFRSRSITMDGSSWVPPPP